jgi:hypothetical protein
VRLFSVQKFSTTLLLNQLTPTVEPFPEPATAADLRACGGETLFDEGRDPVEVFHVTPLSARNVRDVAAPDSLPSPFINLIKLKLDNE